MFIEHSAEDDVGILMRGVLDKLEARYFAQLEGTRAGDVDEDAFGSVNAPDSSSGDDMAAWAASMARLAPLRLRAITA